ncbi:MAG: EAL domain-containing protein [Sideroxydans sp.]|nr:EAL domain-containing protein [Sideroxydans sp.]
MELLPFFSRHRAIYLRYTLLGLALVLAFASVQLFLLLDNAVPRNFIVPTLLGLVIGLLLSTLVAMRSEIISSQRLFRAVADLAQEFIYVRNTEGVYEYVSPSCLPTTGYSQDDFYAQPHLMSRLVLEEDRDIWDRHVFQMHEQGKPESLLIRIRARDGEIRWLEHICSDLRDERGRLLGVRSTNLDVTGRMLKEHQLAIAATAFETHDAILITDAETRIIRANKAFTEITGYEPEEVIGKTPAILKSGKHDKAFYEEMWATLLRDGRWEGELLDRRKNGEIYPKQLTITAVRNEQGEVTNYVGIFSDITTRKAAEEEINRLAYYDTLTSLPNRRLLIDHLQLAMAASDRNQSYGAVLFIDLDNFKDLNDTQGHDVGDQLLVEVAHRLLACVRTGDTVARLGGDEFVVMLANLFDTELDVVPRAESVATKVLSSLNLPYQLNGQQYHGTASIGVTLFHGTEKSVDELLKHSDLALYQAKNHGRATLRFFDPSMQQALELRAQLSKDMHLALREQQFKLYFQPQVNAEGRCVGAEVLLRWEHPERGLLLPNVFIPHAEESGMIADIDYWVLREACQRLQSWQGKGPARIPLAVNVSAAAFMRPDFVDDVLSIVNSTGIDQGLLKLELTETSLINGLEEAKGRIGRLKSAGICFSLDDFGTGYSSLSYLRQLPISQLKIDRAFVRNVVTEAGDAMIAKTIIDMAQNLGLELVAEGVETQAQFDLLVSFGCRTFQGYLFSRPLTLSDFESDNWSSA